jgi:hypothetical protein
VAQRTVIKLSDDLDGKPIPEGRGETVDFGLDGTSYQIDLSSRNAARLRAALDQYVKAARKANGGPAAGRRGRPVGSARQRGTGDAQAIREWGKRSGYKLSERGRIPSEVVQAYEAAHK